MKKNNILKWSLCALVFAFAGCETMDLDQLESPSQPSVNLLDPVYAFNYVQLQLPDFVDSANSFTQRVTRQMAMTSGNTYDNAFAPVNSNTNWNIGYNLLNAVKVMEPKAITNREFYALGASKVIRVYVLMTLVDMYGDIPYSEALMGNANLTPHFDKGEDVYKGLLLELDEAIAVLGQTNNSKSAIQDLYYSSQASWITLANTLKLKMYCNARLAGDDLGVNISSKINEILVANNYIDQQSEDFAFKYGNSRFTPNTRHPLYNDQYEAGGGAYIANYMLWAMTTEKKFDLLVGSNGVVTDANLTYDPRIPFYFCKQVVDPSGLDSFTLPRRTRPDHYNNEEYFSFYFPTGADDIRTPYLVSNWVGQTGMPGNGYLGRDHGDASGIPPDADKRTVAGIYPIGGAYGLSSSVQSGGDKGALGAGIMPMILSSYVHFMLAEVALELPASVAGTSLTAAGELEAGIRESIKKTVNLIPDYPYAAGAEPNPATLTSHENKYVTFVLNKYNNAATNKLELIIKEYFLAAWGNGIEPYNAYRRTGYPSNLQPTLEPASGDFYYTAYYASDSAVNNPNTPTNVRTRRVFWDKAGLTLH
ncbi:SusD/RagB family nutrient-binding outer membrane lipoprotein [Flavobacterium sp. CYK-4]|uniref:SusD/RagB family nutrient-binding outer membrane lipoprotein n=1 Tax=Flavobacterium lotistagni TaxID=2709660 RepID=UPI00140E957B|nr:SusD/RagB family nutrient-binding outer membrane lipoprotein [Flavobacterium lotistagni]NHM05618.1 SusD/RagB family nutrient-binding outer membrane lipoprotein [Flavobacterium lotistagni]